MNECTVCLVHNSKSKNTKPGHKPNLQETGVSKFEEIQTAGFYKREKMNELQLHTTAQMLEK